ncbi:MAG: ABC transporter ATP-binding protein/permease [Oscillospiraceae bacterium]|jgi:putative ABC transport system permease protein|nr:ABC transporter ATP-binding protein/permease [Oscillospiraceae bacterium]
MLKLTGITKHYIMGDTTVEALRGVDIQLRDAEFVAVLGPSGCGKTTLLNIIGGLDRYTSGDLNIDGVSTKEYRDGDWDIYRNKAVGFVFQTYNLIPHQTVLSNVELALTLSGVSKSERRARAADALKSVGLSDQLRKKPNQLSGGQTQRVAIARALVNNPEILLADEPTGALDTETSVQIMEILKEISRDRLVIMVTHNPELADRYASRVVRLLDGRIVGDTNPIPQSPRANERDPSSKLKERRNKKSPLSIATALGLSLNNLLTKKARTILTGFAGSIGIIGIALILSLSSGMRAYIAGIERDTMSSYPIIIQSSAMEMGTLLSTAASLRQDSSSHDLDMVYSKDVMGRMLQSVASQMNSNDLASFKAFLDGSETIQTEAREIQYQYDTPLIVYKPDTSGGPVRLEPSVIMEQMAPSGASGMSGMGSMSSMSSMMSGGTDAWVRLSDSRAALDEEYTTLAGRLPEAWDEVVVIVDQYNEISDYMLFSLGLRDPDELQRLMLDTSSGKDLGVEAEVFTYEELMALTFKLTPQSAVFAKTETGWADRSSDDAFMSGVIENAEALRVVGVVRQESSGGMMSVSGVVGYTSALLDHVKESTRSSAIAVEQMDNPDTDVFTGRLFQTAGQAAPTLDLSDPETLDRLPLTQSQKAQLAALPPSQQQALASRYMDQQSSSATYAENLARIGVSDDARPSAIRIYPNSFEAKGVVTEAILQYNKDMSDAGEDGKVIQYTDFTAMLMSSVDSVIGGISTVLIAFVAISLVVSSIMIGIITYISVLERTKEIGVLRSIGASKGDISLVFNAETLIVGFVAGALGVGITLLLCVPANIIIENLSTISNAAQLPTAGAVGLIAISMVLTFIAGLIPSRMAAKKDPVVALRTE